MTDRMLPPDYAIQDFTPTDSDTPEPGLFFKEYLCTAGLPEAELVRDAWRHFRDQLTNEELYRLVTESGKLAAANAAYDMLCEAVVPGIRNGSAAAMSMSAKLLHRRITEAETATAERIAVWIETQRYPIIYGFDRGMAARKPIDVIIANGIRKDEWRR